MRRVILAVLILFLPSATAVVIYLIVNKRVPTNRDAIGHVNTIAGAGYPGVEDGPVHSASFSDPFGIAVDRRGTLYIADGGQSNRIRRITTDGKVETIAGSTEGFADGNALQAQFNTPSGIAIDKTGNILITDTSNNRIRKLAADGKVTTLAGSGATGYKDGPAGQAEFDGPIGIAIDAKGNVLVADAYNDCIRKISTDGNVTTVAGTGMPGWSDGQAASAAFDTPSGLAIDKDGNILVADTGNHAVRKITAQGEVATIAGKPDDQGAKGNEPRLNHPVGIVVTHDGFVFVSDESSGRIVRIAPEGQADSYAGSSLGFSDGNGDDARFNAPTGIAIDREGSLFVSDSQNFTIRQVSPIIPDRTSVDHKLAGLFIQPPENQDALSERAVIPKLSAATLPSVQSFPWPLSPQDQWHEITGVAGEARGAPGGVALDHLHSGLDIHGSAGDAALSVYDEKVGSPIPNWDFGGVGEGIRVGLFTYIHLRVGRNAGDEIHATGWGNPRIDSSGRLIGLRVRRGTRFRVGDFIGTLNRMNHVHLNFGPWNAQVNPLALPFVGFKDTIPPTIEKTDVVPVGSTASFRVTPAGHLVVSGDVAIVVTAFDRVDGNLTKRKLGLYRIGYQLLDANGAPVAGFEQPLVNLEFNRLPPEGSSVFNVYASGSGVSAYGTPTRFRYVVTNRVRDGEAREGLLRTSGLAPGNYIIKIIAEDYTGNRASGSSSELAVTITK